MSAAGTTYTPIGKLTDIDLEREKEVIETNNFDSPNDEESIAGMKKWGLGGASLFVYNDAGQVLVEAAYESVDPYYFRLTPRAGIVGGYQFTGTGHVTSATLGFKTNEVIKYELEVQGTGALTKTTV